MSILQEIEMEVQTAAASMTAEMIMMLVERLEDNHRRELEAGRVSLDKSLSYYRGLKILLHHMKRKLDEDVFYIHETFAIYGRSDVSPEKQLEKFTNNIFEITQKTKVARRDYYVAKRRLEGEHQSGCVCRGCRCIEEFPGTSSV